MGYGISVEVWGNYALFTRPELRVERYTYDVITPSAARGILEAIFWKPAIKYVIDNILVLNEIKTTNIRRNEVNDKISAKNVASVMLGKKNEHLYLNTSANIAQRASVVLKDVRYVINAHFELTDKLGETDTKEKFYNMILRRIQKGQCFYNPYFGTKEFPANFKIWEEDKLSYYQDSDDKDFGLMLYDVDYTNKHEEVSPMYFRPIMKNGIIITNPNEVEVLM
ncbi:MAG: type I-C CRISPR-associated protein Cas5c [Defluviitaleaceae bacterium]|nr:type I-C CRISPR-associated protein Cas5c [Defluviitaleaceae bacterium]